VDTGAWTQIEQWCSDRFALDDAVAALRRHSLIGPPADGRVSVHRLVQAVTIDQLSAGEIECWKDAAAKLIGAAIPQDVEQRAAWPWCASRFPHALACLDPVSDELWNLAHYLGAAGDYITARQVWAELTTAHEARFGPEHPDTLATRSILNVLDRGGR
jgi:hypothetical protein